MKKQYLTIPEAAKILGISRIAVYRKVKKGQIRAQKIGRVYAIKRSDIIADRQARSSEKRLIDRAICRTVKEYGETLRLLGLE